mmetsp:Transcript_30624/g.37832  ORF Transcript_30624/g.37832 Transcript_30624/m.37832 type:complete len:89 (-) Transcript_30624:52-318(-)
MRDLSPSSYAKLSKQVEESEQDAVDFRTNSSMMKNEESLSKCDAKCRKRQGCQLDYSVNEYKILCMGYDIQYIDTWHYFIESLQTPAY